MTKLLVGRFSMSIAITMVIRRVRIWSAVLCQVLVFTSILAAAGCTKQAVPEGWPIKEIVPARPAKVLSVSKVPPGTWVMKISTKMSFPKMADSLEKTLTKLEYKELPQGGIKPDTYKAYVSADGKTRVILANGRLLQGNESPQSDFILTVTVEQPLSEIPEGAFEKGMTSPHGGGGIPQGGTGVNPHGEGGDPPSGK